MIPLHLTLSGIYSYRGKQEIDFRTLTSAHLFGIFGAVGSGKSAILEAIMFALYGETDRLNNRELRAYNMMNLRCNESFIQFDFLAPADQGEFRATVRGKRNSRNKEDVKFDRSLYRITGAGLIPVELTEIQSILGISYENFRRTIIIPQGKFQEFLQLSATQRTEMVKELFNLHRFDLSAKTGSLQKKNDLAMSACQGQLLQIGEVSEEEISARQEEGERLTRELDATRIQLKQLELLESEMQRICELQKALDTNRQALTALENRREEIQKARQRLEEYDECVTNFKSDVDLLDNKKKQQEAGISELSKKQAELLTEQDKLSISEKRFTLARTAYENREELLRKANELATCAKINTLNKTVLELTGRIANGEEKVKEAQKDWAIFKDQVKTLAELQGTLKEQLPEIQQLQQAKNWFAAERLLAERLQGLQKTSFSLEKELNDLSVELNLLARQFELPLAEQGSADPQIPARLAQRKNAQETELENLRNQLLHLEIQDRLKSFTSELHDGKPCPLCGSTDHPHILQVESVAEEIQKIRDLKATGEKQLQLLEAAITRSEMMLNTINRKKPESVNLAAVIRETQLALETHKNSFLWPGLTEIKLDAEFERYTSVSQEIDKLAIQAKEAASKAETELEKVSKFTRLLEELRIELGKAQQNAETLLSQITCLDYSRYANTTAEALQAESENLRKQYAAVGDEYAAAEKHHNAQSAAVQVLSGTIGTLKQSQQQLETGLTDLQKQLEARILASRFQYEKKVREILTSTIDRNREQQLIREFQEKLATVTSAVEQLIKQLEGKSYREQDHEQLKLQLADLKQNESRQNQLKIETDLELLRMKKALKDAQALKSELKNLEIRSDNLKILSDLFRKQGFVNWVSTIHLQNLVQSANERFYRLTRQQLKLELDIENNFRVRDYLNEGQWRNVKTLSGGQTFQASLCLALALADNIQQLNQSGQNFFFLDEGFGTLDRESLELVFETLKSLRRENRLVGVISHVEDLQQEINAWLSITRDEEHGSRVQASWE